MSNDKMRDEFDSWIEKQGMSTMKDGETYYHRVTHAAWQAWKASRAAPAVQGEPDTHSFLEYPSFEESANFDPVPAVQGEPVAWMTSARVFGEGFTTDRRQAKKWMKSYPSKTTSLYATPPPAEQKPAPDVAQLVEALEELVDLMQGVIDGDYEPDSFTLQPATTALARYRKGAQP